MILYRVAEGGPFDREVDNGVTIENITDDLVNARILVDLVNAGILVPVEPDATWFTIEDPDDTMFMELWARGVVKAVPVVERKTSVKRSGGCFHMIARDDETRWQRWWRSTVIAHRHRKCGGGS